MSRLRRAVSRLLSGSSTAPVSPAAGAVTYAPESDGEPDPGEVVWGWVPYEDDSAQGKDRPVLLLALRGDRARGARRRH